jgi:hypothetical protein
VICNPALGEVVSPDAFTPVSGTHHLFSFSTELIVLLTFLKIKQSCSQHLHGLCPILVL